MTTYKLGELGKWVDKSLTRAEKAMKMAAQNTANEANTPGPSVGKPGGGAGGRLPVVTGNLMRSQGGQVGRMPRGGPVEGSVAAAVARWNPLKGESLYVGWTAAYARPMEYRYGFMRGAVENWDKQVDRAVETAKQLIP